MELRARKSEDRLEVPAVVRVTLPAVESFFATDFQIRTAIGSRRQDNEWLIQPPRVITLSLSQFFVRRQSLTVTLTPYATVPVRGSGRRGTTVSTWLSNGAQELSVTAGVAHDAEGAVSTTLYANFGQTVTGAVRGVADVTYAGGGGFDWMAASGAMTYQVTPALQLALSSRQETSFAGIESSVKVEVNVRVGR